VAAKTTVAQSHPLPLPLSLPLPRVAQPKSKSAPVVPRRPVHPPALGEHVDKEQRQRDVENQDEQHQLLAHKPVLDEK